MSIRAAPNGVSDYWESALPKLQTLLTGLAFGESPRWHDGRLDLANPSSGRLPSAIPARGISTRNERLLGGGVWLRLQRHRYAA